VLPGDGLAHEPDQRACVRHDGGIPLAPTVCGPRHPVPRAGL